MEIESNTIGESHDKIMRHLIELWKIECHDELTTEDNEQTIESPGMKVRVLEPWKEPKASKALQFGPKALEIYINELVGITPPTGTNKDFEYTYGNRLFDYPVRAVRSGQWLGDGTSGGLDQITESIINRLLLNPTSRRAQAVTWVVEKDMTSKEPPCLQTIQCLLRDNKLNLHAVFRSHDMASGWGPNTFALEALQKYIADRVGVTQGYIETYSVSAHMYVHQDQVHKFREHLRI